MDNCIFCNIYAGSIPAKIVLQSNHCFVIEDISPKAPVHMLIIPNVHVNSLFEIPTLNHSLSADIFETASKIANSENLSSRGYRLVLNQGPDAGQTVEHMHIHLLGGQVLGEMGCVKSQYRSKYKADLHHCLQAFNNTSTAVEK